MSGLVTMTPSSATGIISTSPDVEAGDDDTQSSFVKPNANGGVDFQNVVRVSLNDVFTSDYDNYLIVLSLYETNGNFTFALDSITGTYTTQFLLVRSADNAVIGGRAPSTDKTESHIRGICQIHLYGPFLPDATAGRTVGGRIDFKDAAFTTPAGSASGFTLDAGANASTGNIIVMGYAE